MKNLFFASAAALLLSLVSPAPSHAQFAVLCANCSTIQEEVASDAKQAQQYLTQIQQYQTQLQQYANMVQNTVALPTSLFAQVTNDIMQVRNLANSASILTGNSGTILTRLQSAQGYANQASFLPQNIGTQFTQWQQTLSQANNAFGRTVGVQQGQESNYAALQTAIQSHSQSATGQMQAIQAGNEMASLTSTQLNQLQTTLTAAYTAQQTHEIVTDDRQAAEDAAMQQMLARTSIPTTGYTGY